jgi:hypothetical protein
MAVASLTLKIAADLNSFTRDLRKMTRGVDEAAKHVSEIGKTMTLGITLPVGLAAAALSKFAVENEQAAARMQRAFGDSADAVHAELEQIMRLAPLAGTEIQNLAVRTRDTAAGLGFGAQQARQLSTTMLKLATDVAAFRNVATEDALEGLMKGLQGQTRGLKELGIAIELAEVKQEAYRLGLLKIGHELTPLGRSLATYSLMVQRAGHMSGEAGRRQGDLARQFQFLKRDVLEIADRLSNLLLPALRNVAGSLRVLVSAVEVIPNWFWILSASVAAVAAAMGPLLYVSANLVAMFVKLRAAVLLLVAADGLPKLLLLLRTIARDPKIWITMVAIAGAVALATWAFRKFKKELEEAPDLGSLATVAELMKEMEAATSEFAGSPLQKFQQDAQMLQAQFARMRQVGDHSTETFERLVALQREAARIIAENAGKTNEWAAAAAAVYDAINATVQQMNVVGTLSGGAAGLRDTVHRASVTLVSDDALKDQIALQQISDETTLRLREMAIATTEAFDATRLAAVQFGERLLKAAQDFATAMAEFKKAWKSENIAGGAMAGLQAGVAGLLDAFSPFALAMRAVGAVMQGLQPLIDALFTPMIELGRVVGILLTPIFRLLFVPLKYLAIIVAWLGEIIARVTAGLTNALGRFIKAIGDFINWIVPFGNPGQGLVNAGQSMIDFAKGAYDTADQLSKARKEIGRLQFGQTTDDINSLGDAARSTADALLNVPTGFKVALARFRAELPGARAPLPGGGGVTFPGDMPQPGDGDPFGGGSRELTQKERDDIFKEAVRRMGGALAASMNPTRLYEIIAELVRALTAEKATLSPRTVNIVLNGKVLATAVLEDLQSRAGTRFGNSTRWSEVQG